MQKNKTDSPQSDIEEPTPFRLSVLWGQRKKNINRHGWLEGEKKEPRQIFPGQ